MTTMTLEDLAAGHPAALRQLRALRAVVGKITAERNECRYSSGPRICENCRKWDALVAELDVADAAARGER